MILVNGAVGDAISALDRGLSYGDGVFRTFMLNDGRAVHWPRHYAKLASDCAALRIACPKIEIFENDVAQIASDRRDCVVKIIVTRGSGPRGYGIPKHPSPQRIVLSLDMPDHPARFYYDGVKVFLCRTQLARQPLLAGIKHLNRLENVLARSECDDPEIAEGLLCDSRQRVVCGTMSNLFLVRRDVLLTPDLGDCGVAGVQRELVIELAKYHQLPVEITSITLEQLYAADEVFLVNSVIGLWRIAGLGEKVWGVNTITEQVRGWLTDGARR